MKRFLLRTWGCLALLGASHCAPAARPAPGAPSSSPSAHTSDAAAPQAQNEGGVHVSSDKTTGATGAPPPKSPPPAAELHGAATDKSSEGALTFAQRNHSRAQECGKLTCYSFSTAAEALQALLEAHQPVVVAFGEAHAPQHFAGASTVSRFTQQLLPVLAPQSNRLLVELLAPPKSGCGQAQVAAQKESDQITSGQKQENKNEYLLLGNQARQRKVVPDILRASCEDLAHIAAPEGGVLAYMETIARLFERDVTEALRRSRATQNDPTRPLVLTYGGALHNDVLPRAGRETWSFAPTLVQTAEGRFLEVDLIVPELITASDAWRSFAWYDAYQASSNKAVPQVIPWGEHSAALIFSAAAP